MITQRARTMRACVLRLAAAACILALGCRGDDGPPPPPPEYVPPTEWLTFTFDGRDWQPGGRVRANRVANEIFVLPGESTKTWTELVSVSLTYGAQRGTQIPRLLEATKETLEEKCPGLDWQLIEQDERSAVFAWVSRMCKEADEKESGPQTRIARIELGRLGLHQITYDAKTRRLAAGLRQRWIETMRDAQLGPREAAPVPSIPIER
jgi:hypothetical protein